MSKGKPKGSSNGNRLLKYAALSAALGALRSENRLSRHYREMLAKGIRAGMAQRTTARGILSMALIMWKTGTEYRDAN